MERYQYPVDLDTSINDHIVFECYPYKLNSSTSAFGPTKAQITLYMPNTTPAAHYGHDMNFQTFPGPLGANIKAALGGLGGAGMQPIMDRFNEAKENLDGKTGIEQIMGQVDEVGGSQAALQFLASKMGSDAATALALGKNKIYNPNAELLYGQPHHRKYSFNFDLTPKSSQDTRAIDGIIKAFKKYSSPELQGQYMSFPFLWRIKYMEASKGLYRRMNRFKPMMISNFVVQDNPLSDYHITIDDPSGAAPVQTSIAIFLQETQPLTRSDHDTAGALRGF